MRRVALVTCGLIIVAQVGLLGLALTSADSPDRLETPIEPAADLNPPVDLEAVLPFAGDVATGWKSDAALVRANMQIDWPRDKPEAGQSGLPSGGWIFFTFLSDDGLLTMRIDRGSGVIVDTRILSIDEPFGSKPIDLSQASTRSGTAARAAEAAYGAQFRAACPDKRFTSWLTVQADPTGTEREWHIEYESRGDEPQPSMSLDVDWQSGQIENVANANEPCP